MAEYLPSTAFLGSLGEMLMGRRGFSLQAVASAEMGRAVRKLMESGQDLEVLAEKINRDDPGLVHELCASVAVGETYFFRHAEHFEFLKNSWIPEIMKSRSGGLRIWSAGCATGEEAYSLAAFLLAELGPACDFSVLGTDLLERSLRAARQGDYGAWSVRRGNPLLYPVLNPAPSAPYSVLQSCRERVRFAGHDLLQGAPEGEGPFELIFCRNVLVYFAEDKARMILETLRSCLSPGGLLVLGAMDCSFSPEGLQPCGHSGMQLFRRAATLPRDRRKKPASAELVVPAPALVPVLVPALAPVFEAAAPPEQKPDFSPLELHLEALRQSESGDERGAGKALAEMARRHPQYLPGRLEHALWLQRQRRVSEALLEMRGIVRACSGRDPFEPVEGLMTLPLGYLLASATAFLQDSRNLG